MKREGDGGKDRRSDADLLAHVDSDPDAFGVLYERYSPMVFGYIHGLVANEDISLELTTEVFATALRRSGRRRVRRKNAPEWLLSIADRTLAFSYRLGSVKDTSRRKLGVPIQPIAKAEWEAVAERFDTATEGPLKYVPTLGVETVSIREALRRRLSKGAK